MQVNKVGIFLIALFGGLGIAFLVVPIPGEAGGIFKLIGAIWVGVAALMVVYLRREKRSGAQRLDLQPGHCAAARPWSRRPRAAR